MGGKVVGGTVVIDLAHFTAGGYLLAGVIADSWPIYLPVIALAAKSIPVFVRAGSDSFALSLLSYTDAFFTGALIILVIRMFLSNILKKTDCKNQRELRSKLGKS